ncbi:hypothetical protein JR316_0007328 [Psilocybe cubensis]|uniref:Uncharacterized protein n=2 Tax=Psilocybe cubensis TaxID=181762 RepID=A0ACB8GYL2_PSICU|nr:hypothetical protein JR316_0007328 [Psilocybe cubensis]KAH9480728.1 hypothetical protein JR316_0007328 [Psilocybe cubensis]
MTLPSKTPTTRYRTSNPYETRFGFSRAVRKGPHIFVAGTTSTDPVTGNVLYPKSAYDQTMQIFREIIKAIESLGGTKDDVVRMRIYVANADSEDGQKAGDAFKEVFGTVGPAATMIFGMKLMNPDMKIEIEADAVVL